MGNSRSRNRSRPQRNNAVAVNANESAESAIDGDLQRLAELLFIRQELESRLHDENGGRRRRRRRHDGDDDVVHRLLRHHLLLEYMEHARFVRDSDDDEEEDEEDVVETDVEDEDNDVYEGIAQLFLEDSERSANFDEAQIKAKGEKLRRFRDSMLELLEGRKQDVEKRIDSALDLQRNDAKIVDNARIAALNATLISLGDHVDVLNELTRVKEEDVVLCMVCLSCPRGIIWNCCECDHLLCAECRRKVTACPTCRAKFAKKPARRNRWAEKLARLQLEKETASEVITH